MELGLQGRTAVVTGADIRIDGGMISTW